MTHTGTVTKDHWQRFFRWGPYGLLALGAFLAFLTLDELTTAAEERAIVPLTAAALTLQVLRTAGRVPDAFYYWTRTVLAFALTWLNPLFAVYATMGYFDAADLLPRRWVRAGLFVNAIALAGSQSGGLPPSGGLGWAVFGAVLVLHVSLLFVISGIYEREERQAATRLAMIEELERTNNRLEQALRENAALHAQLLVQAREAGVNDERRRLAAEIHDTIAQGLTGIVTQLQAVRDPEDPHVQRAQALARDSLREARRSVQNLAPAHLEHDTLPQALKKIVNELPTARLTVTGTVEPLHEEIEATLLRIAQEALNNAVRHAAADRIGVTLTYMDDEVTLDVRDDGRGFTRPTRGFGLNGMRERAERVLGTLEIESEPGRGTAVSARVPLVRHG